MLVQEHNLSECLKEISAAEYLAVDTETTGLMWYKKDRLFSMSIATKDKEYYFDFLNTLSLDSLSKVFGEIKGILFMHNAKFDMHFLAKENIPILNYKIIDTMILARLVKNERLSLSLDTLAKEVGYEKLDTVKKYLLDNKHYDFFMVPGKKKREKIFFFDKAPLAILQPYAERDARITYALGIKYLDEIKKHDSKLPNNFCTLESVLNTEIQLTKTLFKMEETGIKIDPDFTKKAHLFEGNRALAACQNFTNNSGFEFLDSGKHLAKIFDFKGYSYEKTEKGNPCFNDDALEKMDNPLAENIRQYRRAYKAANTYYVNFLWLSDSENIIHATANQVGTATGRMSYSEPNLQNLNKVDEDDPEYGDEFLVRRCFVPRPGYTFYMFDFEQMEYRLMLDYAKEMSIIEEIKGGKDIHQATADMMGITRRTAKTINFMLLYGGGVQKLADALKLSYAEANDLRNLYFSKLPNVTNFIRDVVRTAERRGYILNCFGRKYYFQRDFAYKAPNYLIQGGCADIIKTAMIKIDSQLPKTSRLLVQVHDELVFEISEEDKKELVPWIQFVMATAYKPRILPMAVNISSSNKSWQDAKGI
jgi:DNA polymerase-1